MPMNTQKLRERILRRTEKGRKARVLQTSIQFAGGIYCPAFLFT